MITVIHHSADYDGLFCREIAKKFLPEATLIGWDHGDEPLKIPPEGTIYVLDLPVDKVFGDEFSGKHTTKFICTPEMLERVVWIDHHASSIATHDPTIPGYRIDGVAACRLAWQWFANPEGNHQLPMTKHAYVQRLVAEPLAVLLAGEYDVWDHRDDGDLEFQFGLDCQPSLELRCLLDGTEHVTADRIVQDLLYEGSAAMRCYAKRDADIMRTRSFMVEFDGLKFLALNTARCNSNTFAAKDVPGTGHDALMAFYWNGRAWNISLYHASHRKDIDLSLIASKRGGGGHRGACGFRVDRINEILGC